MAALTYALSLHDALPICADVDHERRGELGHLLDLVERVRHHRQRAERERRVGGLVHDHVVRDLVDERDRKSTRLNSSHPSISYAVFCLKKKTFVDVIAMF